MVQSLPGFLDLCLDVCSPSQVLGDVYTEVLEAAHPLHRGPTDHKRGVGLLLSLPEVYSVHSNISPENMDKGVDQVVVQNEVSDSEEAPASTSPGSSFTSPTVTRSNVNKRKWPETPDFLDRYLLSKEARESKKEESRREKEERREQQNDDNYLFALGLILALRRLSLAVQSSVKIKMHQLLHDTEFGQSSSAFFPHQSPVSYHQVTPQTPTNYGCSTTTSWPH